ncbi:RHS repeat domain-containing protein [Mangrovibacterium marinum]|uniref:YD repeat-containing protein n=1 Tax=Mangrovibacterium marinum TaxID=1639118 RepID=A0A2T5BX45_9BACT|nr:RHS repeat domain-containing protein [Mangrovibacterium marinum]PTN04254.1 YD repeat-containing protein [Mangrovibacterium marinum]
MRKSISFLPLVTALVLFSCSSSSSLDEGFEDANKDVSEKLLKQVRYDAADEYEEDVTLQFNYDGQKRLTSITDGDGSRFFNYDSESNLTSITGSDETFEISELYEAPYDAFEEGNVQEYDDNGNPSKLEIFESSDYNDEEEMLIAELSYAAKPNPFYYTLKAGGIIDVLNDVELDFGSTSPSIVKAYKLLPYNNIESIIIKDMNGLVQAEVHFDTTYDQDGYATSTTVQYLDGDDTDTSYITYSYQ